MAAVLSSYNSVPHSWHAPSAPHSTKRHLKRCADEPIEFYHQQQKRLKVTTPTPIPKPTAYLVPPTSCSHLLPTFTPSHSLKRTREDDLADPYEIQPVPLSKRHRTAMSDPLLTARHEHASAMQPSYTVTEPPSDTWALVPYRGQASDPDEATVLRPHFDELLANRMRSSYPTWETYPPPSLDEGDGQLVLYKHLEEPRAEVAEAGHSAIWELTNGDDEMAMDCD